jgi:RNA polymerase sigma-70 factor (ECF subfamily)
MLAQAMTMPVTGAALDARLSDRDETILQITQEIPRLRRYARYLTRNVDNADDLVQDCVVRAIEKIDTFEPGTNLRAWLVVILRNAFFTTCRKKTREDQSLTMLKQAAVHVIPAQQEEAMTLSEVEDAFLKLSPDHREVLTLVVIEGMSYEQVADVLDVSIGTVKSRLSRARSALNQMTETDTPLAKTG